MTQTAVNSGTSGGDAESGIWGYLVLLALGRLAISWGVGQSGLVALSDDDYARVTIAQRFAEHAKVDPSGTSWLPFPLWVTGGVMKLLDPSLDVARAASAALAIGAAWLLFAAGRVWGFTERQAFVAALAANALPVVAVLGSVTVPELPTAALGVFALIAVTTPARSRRGLGFMAGAAMLAATLSRYEAWPVAVVVAIFAWVGQKGPIWKRVVATALPLLGPAWWILHNRLAHGDALSFLRRASSYRAALGSSTPELEQVLGLLGGFVFGCPAALLAVMGLAISWFRGEDRPSAKQHMRRFLPWGLAAAALVGFLAVAQILGGAPTHHPGRPLLLLWLLATLAALDLSFVRRAPLWLAAPIALLLVLDYRSELSDHGVDRRSEETAGTQLRSLVPRGQRVFIATKDYGYFAVMAAFGRPGDTIIDQTHDPRSKNEKTLLDDRWNAHERLRAQGASWLVAPATIVFPMILREHARDGHLAIYELYPSRQP